MLDRGRRRYGRDPYERRASRLMLAISAAVVTAVALVGARAGAAMAVVVGLPAWPIAVGCAVGGAAMVILACWFGLRG